MKTGFSLCSISYREKPVFSTWDPCNENRNFPVGNTTQGKPCFHYCAGMGLQWFYCCQLRLMGIKKFMQTASNTILSVWQSKAVKSAIRKIRKIEVLKKWKLPSMDCNQDYYHSQYRLQPDYDGNMDTMKYRNNYDWYICSVCYNSIIYNYIVWYSWGYKHITIS